MSVWAFFSTSTGIIQSMLGNPISDPKQVAALLASGIGILEVPDGTDGANSMIDVSTLTVISIKRAAPIPDLFTQYVAAQINSGNLDASAFHPVTLTQMNVGLDAANLSPVTVPLTSSSDTATNDQVSPSLKA